MHFFLKVLTDNHQTTETGIKAVVGCEFSKCVIGVTGKEMFSGAQAQSAGIYFYMKRDTV